MAIRAFFRKVREIEQTISTDFVVVVSNETTDGGRAGVETEVTRLQAAKLMADGKARLATPEESTAFREASAERWRQSSTEQADGRPAQSVGLPSDLNPEKR